MPSFLSLTHSETHFLLQFTALFPSGFLSCPNKTGIATEITQKKIVLVSRRGSDQTSPRHFFCAVGDLSALLAAPQSSAGARLGKSEGLAVTEGWRDQPRERTYLAVRN